ncbi:hypothetical protein Ahy_B01g051756 [Arachis hypogaea]|uniref:Aminotransferase-like plant mobile domain-containing protein n=1 Tax=Arachis hypogaea TaxID=3818 RepID=A0A445AMQ9_ARAHY|nr:hypothetical protein Ahy_B01g051756 [Arachis hypogaea]
MPFRKCAVTLQDVAFQLGFPVNGKAVSGCLTEFENSWRVADQFGNGFRSYSVSCHHQIRVLPANATEDTVRMYARAYIMMLLPTQLFRYKCANRRILMTWAVIAGGPPHLHGCINACVGWRTEMAPTWGVISSYYRVGSSGGFPL